MESHLQLLALREVIVLFVSFAAYKDDKRSLQKETKMMIKRSRIWASGYFKGKPAKLLLLHILWSGVN